MFSMIICLIKIQMQSRSLKEFLILVYLIRLYSKMEKHLFGKIKDHLAISRNRNKFTKNYKSIGFLREKKENTHSLLQLGMSYVKVVKGLITFFRVSIIQDSNLKDWLKCSMRSAIYMLDS